MVEGGGERGQRGTADFRHELLAQVVLSEPAKTYVFLSLSPSAILAPLPLEFGIFLQQFFFEHTYIQTYICILYKYILHASHSPTTQLRTSEQNEMKRNETNEASGQSKRDEAHTHARAVKSTHTRRGEHVHARTCNNAASKA